VALYLGANHPIVLSNGSVLPIGSVVNSTVKGIGWFITGFREQNITVTECDKDLSLWKVISKSGREITCTDNTKFLSPSNKWENFSHPPNKKYTGHLKIDIRSVNYLPVYGTKSEDQTWVNVISNSLSASLKQYPHYVQISNYFCQLDESTLESLMYEIRSRFARKLYKGMDISTINFDDQRLLFHLFDRTKRIRCTAKGSTRVMVGTNDKNKKIFRVRPTRSAKTILKDPNPLCNDIIGRYYKELVPQEIVKVSSQFGNFVDKSFICQT